MVDAYEEDDSIAPEHAAAKIGERISWGARAIDGIGAVTGVTGVGAVFNGTFSQLLGFSSVPTALGSLGITGFAPWLAGATALGEGLKVVDDVVSGDMKKAGKHTVVGAAKAGVIFLDGMTMGLAEIPSLLFTGKFLSTNVGDVVGQMLDGADKATKPTSNLAAVGYTAPQYTMPAPPPTDVRRLTQDTTPPYGYQPPEGGWRGYVTTRRQGGVAQQPGEEQAPVTSGNPRWQGAVQVATDVAALPQLNG